MKATAETTSVGIQRAGWEMLAAPRMVAWVGNDVQLSDAEKVALLRRDVYLIDLPVLRHHGAQWLKPWSHAYAINFDYVKKYRNRFRKQDDLMIANDICSKLASSRDIPCIVYGSEFSRAEANLFEKNGIHCVFGEVKSKIELLSLLKDQILPRITGEQRQQREVVRLRVGPGIRIMVVISIVPDTPSQGSAQLFRGVLCDVSPLGLGLTLHRTGMRLLHDRQLASIHINWHTAGITIKKAVVTRVDERTGNIGLAYNLENCDSVDENEAFRLGKLISDQIGNAIRSEFQFARYAHS